MRLVLGRDFLHLVPDNDMEIGWIENALGLVKEGDSIPLKRIAPAGLSIGVAYLEAGKE